MIKEKNLKQIQTLFVQLKEFGQWSILVINKVSTRAQFSSMKFVAFDKCHNKCCFDLQIVLNNV